jgi:septal ring factor EnvC (AmiA/AmiB activator)
LSGMSTSFSTSLFGLASSLVLGFLDLQAGHAQNRFYNELEEWLSGMTRLSSGALHGDGDASVPAYVQALLEQTADGLERMQRALTETERERRNSSEQLGELNTQIGRLADLLGRESREIRGMAETQEELKNVLKTMASTPNSGARLSDELRGELRLLSRTIAAAVDGKRGMTQ